MTGPAESSSGRKVAAAEFLPLLLSAGPVTTISTSFPVPVKWREHGVRESEPRPP